MWVWQTLYTETGMNFAPKRPTAQHDTITKYRYTLQNFAFYFTLKNFAHLMALQ